MWKSKSQKLNVIKTDILPFGPKREAALSAVLCQIIPCHVDRCLLSCLLADEAGHGKSTDDEQQLIIRSPYVGLQVGWCDLGTYWTGGILYKSFLYCQ